MWEFLSTTFIGVFGRTHPAIAAVLLALICVGFLAILLYRYDKNQTKAFAATNALIVAVDTNNKTLIGQTNASLALTTQSLKDFKEKYDKETSGNSGGQTEKINGIVRTLVRIDATQQQEVGKSETVAIEVAKLGGLLAGHIQFHEGTRNG